MKATGIVRRIDDLGRVVIPKEIRRTLKIREGDPLEIFVDRDGEVILKKYFPISELGQFAQEYAEALFDSLNTPVLICDRDDVIAVAGKSKKEFLNKTIGSDITKAIESRTQLLKKEKEQVEVLQDKELTINSYCLVPIIANGDAIGCIFLFSDENHKFSETAAVFLGKQME